MTLELTVKTEDAGTRLDAFIAAHAPELTRSQAARLIEEGAVTVGSARPAKSARVAPGETVAVRVPAPQETVLTAQDIPLDVVYEDEDVIVVNKPTGMVVHPAPGHPDGTLVNALLHHCGDSLSGVGGEKRPGIVHRIDRDTSGLTPRTSPSRRSSRITRSRGHMSALPWETSARTAAPSTRPSDATRPTARRWPSRRKTAAEPSRTGRSSPAIRA